MITSRQRDLVRETWQQILPLQAAASAIFYDKLFQLDPTVYEATYRMAAILKSQSRWADAANEYDKARQLQGRAGISTYSDEIARALAELKTRLGSVQILTEHKGRCRKRTQWLPPGRHMVKLGKETRLVVVSVGQHSEVGQCP